MASHQHNQIAKLRKEAWKPTKAELHRGRWRAARKGGVASRLTADLQIEAYEKALRQHAGGMLLDLGCGNAPFAGIYRTLATNYVWADWRNSPHQLFDLDHEVDLNRAPLPFESEAFDTVLLTDVLEHVAEPDQLIAEITRVLRPGGKFVLGVPFLYPIHEQPYDFHRYTQFKLEHFASKHGLDVLELVPVGGPIDVWTELTCKILAAVWSPLARVPYHGWRTLRAIPFVRRVNEEVAWKMPLAYVAVFVRGNGDRTRQSQSLSDTPLSLPPSRHRD